jgi:hypothetical protein
MAGLPKKYAKMGFKRGWRAFKASRGTRKGKSHSRMSGIVDYPLMGRHPRPKRGSSKAAKKGYKGYWRMARPYDASGWMSKHHKLHGAGSVISAATSTLKAGALVAGGVILGRIATSLIMNNVKQIPAAFAPALPIGLGIFGAFQRTPWMRLVGVGSAAGALVKLGDRYVMPMLPASLQGEGEITSQDVEQALLGGEIRPDEAALLVDEYGLRPTPALLGAIETYAGEIEEPALVGDSEDMYGEGEGDAGGY